MLERLRRLAERRTDFAFETTLAGRGHARWLQELRSRGYRTHMIFLALPSADLAVARVQDRVRRGGHHVPEDIVRRRFQRGLQNLLDPYLPVCDGGQIYDNSQTDGARLIASWSEGRSMEVADAQAWQRLKEQAS